MKWWPNGFGEALGPTIGNGKPTLVSGDVWFVNSTTGVDAAAPAGKDRQKPLATLGQAVTNAAAGDFIILSSAHAETISATLSIAKQLYIFGGGSATVPTATITPNVNGLNLLSVSAAGVEIHNIRFKENLSLVGGTTKITIGGVVNVRVVDCYFDMGSLDLFNGLLISSAGAVYCRVERCTFVSTATSSAAQPQRGCSVGTTTPDVEIVSCTFDDGTYGFSLGAFQCTAQARTRVTNCSFLRGADVAGTVPTASYFSGITQTGGGRVNF